MLQTPASEDAAAEARPAWHWVLIGACLVVALFLPLSAVGVWLGGRLAQRLAHSPAAAAALAALPVLVAFVVSAWGAGAFVGRFGRRARAGGVILAGAFGGCATFALAALGGALKPWPVAVGAALVLVGIGGGCAVLGAAFGRRRRP